MKRSPHFCVMRIAMLCRFRKSLLESPLSWVNYTEKFHLLLYLEELQMEVDIRRYNIPNNDNEHAVLKRDPHHKKLLVLEVNMCDSPSVIKFTFNV